MAIYHESKSKIIFSSIFLFGAFLLLYSPLQLGWRELYMHEGLYAVMAKELNYTMPVNIAHGELIANHYPLFGYFSKIIFDLFGISMELALRLVSVVSLFLISLIVYLSARRADNRLSGYVAVAVVISSNIVIEKALDGYPFFLALFFIFGGWIMWFLCGFVYNKWSWGWFFAFLAMGFSFLTIGVNAIIFFAFPFIFMRRPLTIWTKLKHKGFALGIVLLVAFILFWVISRQLTGLQSVVLSTSYFSLKEYLQHLVIFPFDVIWRFMPWSIFIWAPFCVAMQPLIKSPIFCRYLRTIILSLFLLLWLSPFHYGEVRYIAILAPPIAILTGMNYWLLIRRYGDKFKYGYKFLNIGVLLAGIFVIVIYIIPEQMLQLFNLKKMQLDFIADANNFIAGMIAGSILLTIWVFLRCFMNSKKYVLWVHMLTLVVSCAVLFWSVVVPYKAQRNDKREFGNALNEILIEHKVDSNMPIYKYKIATGYARGFYSQHPVFKIDVLENLSSGKNPEKIIYVLSPEYPVDPARRWTSLTPQGLRDKNSKNKQPLELWVGTLLSTSIGDNGKFLNQKENDVLIKGDGNSEGK
ncbi:hypothetical protein AAEX28_08475 [Lentisphaerota bacterium WC36G]|nr:glycosyltransferase family 39 protein [Lentisphaerae bacterium WC36]